jgi:SulP family sulfate permease
MDTFKLKPKKIFPFLSFYRDPQTLWADLVAGVTVGLVLVPQAMAYAALAEMPPETGLYAASFACIVGAAFGQCAIINTGPVAMTSLLSAAALVPLAVPDTELYVQLAAILALMVGVSRIVIGSLKGTFLVTLISKPVLVGFTVAAGLSIASTQVPKFFNIDDEFSENPLVNVVLLIFNIHKAHLPSLFMGLGTLATMVFLKKRFPRWPGLLMALIGASVLSHLIDFESMGGQIVGDLPAGLPSFSVPSDGWRYLPDLVGAALLVSIIGLLEVMTVTSAAEKKTRQRTDLNRELIGQGMASLCAGMSSGFPVSGSLSRSSLNLLAGAKTGLSSVFSGLVVLLTLMWLTPLLKPVPYPALAAAIVMAVSGLVRPHSLFWDWKVCRSDATFGFATLLITLGVAPEFVVGMGWGIGLNIVWYFAKVMEPRCILLEKGDDGRWAKALDQGDISLAENKGAIVVRTDVRITFLNSAKIIMRLKGLVLKQKKGIDCILCASGINDIDVTACDGLVEMRDFMNSSGGRLLLADVKAPVRKRLHAHPELVDIRIFAGIEQALSECEAKLAKK